MKVGLLLGSFNPIHQGHLLMARYWLNETDIAQLWLVVSPQNPHKPSQELAKAEHRLTMAKLATHGDPHVQVSDIEFSLPLPSYTIQTLNTLRKEHPDKEWFLLMGLDTAHTLPSWKEGMRILQEWHVWVYPRGDTSLYTPPQGRFVKYFAKAPRIDLSATQIRKYVKSGLSIRYLVPPPVEEYIHAQRIYYSESSA
ncbi:MAG: nicotinate (nicotinamide) nucleotide adenylyltransferase [Bacteroidia bacterium]|nr:nicotinate (nicotinamide) nucleotide adenylyltransferase [Bacteroidia bacterium]MDW8133557.1 nicotinate (nicotinamide) nucleotide adenylyltransferase [Bacteroidia bacterium]